MFGGCSGAIFQISQDSRGPSNPSKKMAIQVEPGKPGAEVSKKKTISQRKNLPIEFAQGDQPRR